MTEAEKNDSKPYMQKQFLVLRRRTAGHSRTQYKVFYELTLQHGPTIDQYLGSWGGRQYNKALECARLEAAFRELELQYFDRKNQEWKFEFWNAKESEL